MKEAQKQFEYFYGDDVNTPAGDSIKKLCKLSFESAWQHQQQRIDELEKKLELCQALMQSDDKEVIALQGKLKIAIYAMKKYHEEMQHQGFEGGECLLEALKQIEVK